METDLKKYFTEIKSRISQGSFEIALALVDNLIHDYPKNEYIYYYKGICNFGLGRYYLAIKNYSLSLQLNQGFARAYFNIGVCYYMIKYYDYALINIGKALFIFSKLNNENAKQRCIKALKFIESERI